MVLKMPFLTFTKADIWFAEQKVVWRIYTAAEAVPTTRRINIIDKKEFAAAALNADDKAFVLHVVALAKPTIIPIYPFCQA